MPAPNEGMTPMPMDEKTAMPSAPPYEAHAGQMPQPSPIQHTGSHYSGSGAPQGSYHQVQHPISPLSPPAQYPQSNMPPPGPEMQKAEYSSNVQPVQQHMPIQQQQHMPVQQHMVAPQVQTMTQPTFATAIPLASLQKGPAPVDCPVCKTRNMTRTEFHSGNTTHLWAIVCGICLGLCCVPYFVKGTKDCEHKCSHCGAMLATHKNSGTTEVHAYA